MDRNHAADILEEHAQFDGVGPLVEVGGMSSPRVCHFLNRLVAQIEPGECYLEVGTWRGLTLLSAAYGNLGRPCIGCDKFRFWGRFSGWGFAAKRSLRSNLERYRDQCGPIVFHAMTSERMFRAHPPPAPVGVYFYDGDHSHAGTARGITMAAPYLARRSVLLVDDWNDPVIGRATREALDHARLRILWFRDLKGDHSTRGWWNGVGVFYLEKP